MAKKKKEAESATLPLRLEWRSPTELAANPRNWRRHPEAQIAALGDVLGEVGWAGACLYNERTGRLIDGHARQKIALAQGAELVPVLVGSWDEAAEAKILATLDPLAAMATADAAALDALLRDVNTGSQALADMLTGLAEAAGVVPDAEPLADLPDLARTESHTITVRYSPDDLAAIKRFIGWPDADPLDPVRTGKMILGRIKAIVADRADQ